MTLDQFIDKYGTHGSGLILSDAASVLEKDKPFLAKVLRELERDLASVLTSVTEPVTTKEERFAQRRINNRAAVEALIEAVDRLPLGKKQHTHADSSAAAVAHLATDTATPSRPRIRLTEHILPYRKQ